MSDRERFKIELTRVSSIQELPLERREKLYRVLEKIEDRRLARKRTSSTDLRLSRDGFSLDRGVLYAALKWLEDHNYILSEGKRPKDLQVTEIGREALLQRTIIDGLYRSAKIIAEARDIHGQLDGLDELFGNIFKYMYGRLERLHDIETYFTFLEAVEGSSYRNMNLEISTDLEAIKQGTLRGQLRDPYFSIQSIFLPALYFDAQLAREMGHFLSYNHRFVLRSASEGSDDDFTRHNQEWVKRFEEEEMEGEAPLDDFDWNLFDNKSVDLEEFDRILQEMGPSEPKWRLSPRDFVRHEIEIRRRHKLLPKHSELLNRGTDCTYENVYPNFYDVKNRLFSRNGFQENQYWSIDVDKARKSYNLRRLEKRASKWEVSPDVLIEMESMSTYEPHYRLSEEGVFAKYFDENGNLVKEIKLK